MRGGLRIEARANGRYETNTRWRDDDPGISPPVGREIGSQGYRPPAISVEKSTTVRIEVADLPDPIDVRGPWEVHFPGGSGAPEKISLDRLISWSQHTDPGVKYFSGTATYRKTLDVPANWISPAQPRDSTWTSAASRSWREPGSTATTWASSGSRRSA